MVAPLMPEIATQWLSNGEAQRLIALQRQQLAERQQAAHPLLAGLDYRWQPEHPHLWLPLPEPWTSQAFAAALRQHGVLVRTSDQFAAGRTTAPRAIRISLNSARNLDQLAQGLATVRRLLDTVDPGTLAH
jgi:DNA-binding transcriptional MocR family regulator